MSATQSLSEKNLDWQQCYNALTEISLDFKKCQSTNRKVQVSLSSF